MASITLAIVYTPEQGMPLILSRITDRLMLRTAIRNAVVEAEGMAHSTAGDDVFASRGYREQADVLKHVLGELSLDDQGSPVVQ